MKRVVCIAAVAWLVCARAAASAPSGTAFSGEVWNWDEARNTVTLRSGAQTVRVRVTPDQLRGLRLHESATVVGQVDPLMPIEQVVTTHPPVTPVASGLPQASDTMGTIAAVDPNGLVSVDSPRGRLVVWIAIADTSRFQPGSQARVKVSVQPVDMVPLSDPRAQATLRESQPAALVGTEPSDHAIVTGRVIRVDPAGSLTIESPRGPVTVAVPDAQAFRDGVMAEVRTLVQAEP